MDQITYSYTRPIKILPDKQCDKPIGPNHELCKTCGLSLDIPGRCFARGGVCAYSPSRAVPR